MKKEDLMKRIKGAINKLIRKIKDNKKTIAFVGAGVLVGSAGTAFAIAVPAAGSFAFDVYDIAVNRILDGPIGFVAGVGAMAVGAVCAVQQKVFEAVPCILGGAILLNADSLVTSLGMIV